MRKISPSVPGIVSLVMGLAAIGWSVLGCGGGTKMLTRAELMDPTACKDCHPTQYADWSRSMHAYASEDPVFRAMNRRGQDETNGALGDFCVKCHAPVAFSEGLTTNGLNLDALAPSAKGVTCFFCHSAASVDTAHSNNNNSITLGTDGTLFGPFSDPVPGTPHRSTYSTLFDLSSPDSAQACGSCHDIVNQNMAALERTYSEWHQSLFSDPKLGQTCVRCHMNQTEGPASTMSNNKTRALGSHLLPGVDLALTPFPADDPQAQTVQARSVQELLDSVLQGTLCVDVAGQKIEVSLDNVNAGHFWPSGATPDRRAWIEVTAYSGVDVIYQSGNVPMGQTVETIADPDLWLMRDCLFDDTHAPVHMFWEAASVSPSNQIPGPVKLSALDPSTFYKAHVKYVYPVTKTLPMSPDRVTLKVHLKAIGDDVLADLVSSKDASGNGYLAADVAAKVPQFDIGIAGAATIEWTPQTAVPPFDIQSRTTDMRLRCVQKAGQYRTLPDVAISHANCQLGQP
jgi:hypothetical protein